MRVCIVPEYPMSLMTGGLQVQAIETYRALSVLSEQTQPELFNWSELEPPADLYHFVGFPSHLHRISQLVRQAKRPYLITLLFGCPRDPWVLWNARIRQYTKSHLLGRRERYNAITGAAAIIVITEADAAAAHTIYGIDRQRIHIVPNGVSDAFFHATPAAWHRKYGQAPFVLCVGAIQQRKNQLSLVQACNQAQLSVVLLGPVLPGERHYAEKVRGLVEQNQNFGGIWLEDLNNDNPLLPSAYAACRLFALLSSTETQPLSVMQAMAAKRPVLLLRAPYCADSLFRDLPVVPSLDASVISEHLRSAWERGKGAELSPSYSWPMVARKLSAIYKRCMRGA